MELNNTGDTEDKYSCNESDSNLSVVSSYLLCVFVGSSSVLTICGNSLVIVSIMYFKQLRTPTNYLILSLAVADLLVGVIVLPFSTVLAVSSCWYLAGLLCKIRGLFDMSLCACSIVNLCFISVDRYYVVCQPLLYRTRMTPCATSTMVLVSWAVPGLITIISAVPAPEEGPSSGARCRFFQNSKSALIGAVLLAFVPAIAVVIFSLYMKILAVALRQARSIRTTTKSGASVSKVESKATKTLAIVVGIYLLCWSPYFLSISFYPLSSDTMPLPMIEAFKWLGWSNSMINPFVYGFFYKWFRTAFKLIISGKIFQGDCSNFKLI